jgi:hypothetical protein
LTMLSRRRDTGPSESSPRASPVGDVPGRKSCWQNTLGQVRILGEEAARPPPTPFSGRVGRPRLRASIPAFGLFTGPCRPHLAEPGRGSVLGGSAALSGRLKNSPGRGGSASCLTPAHRTILGPFCERLVPLPLSTGRVERTRRDRCGRNQTSAKCHRISGLTFLRPDLPIDRVVRRSPVPTVDSPGAMTTPATIPLTLSHGPRAPDAPSSRTASTARAARKHREKPCFLVTRRTGRTSARLARTPLRGRRSKRGAFVAFDTRRTTVAFDSCLARGARAAVRYIPSNVVLWSGRTASTSSKHPPLEAKLPDSPRFFGFVRPAFPTCPDRRAGDSVLPRR